MTKEFKSYQHVERFGSDEVDGIEMGTCHVFPKIDGTNASIWFSDGEVQCGSRKRHLTLDYDNAGFLEWALKQENIFNFFLQFPDARLYGEWLVPHSLKTYRKEAWRNFYVFDVCWGEEERLMPYTEYQQMLAGFQIAYIPPFCTIKNGSYDQFIHQLSNNVFLIEDGQGTGEGIVIKNYDYVNRFGRQAWAKIVTSEFKEKHAKEMGGPEINGTAMIEERIAEDYATTALIEKEFEKIKQVGWSSRNIPQLLNTVYYCVVKESAWDFVKEHKNPKVDFKRLQHFVYARVKQVKSDLF